MGELRSDCGRGGDPSGEGEGPMWGCGARTASGGNSAAMCRARVSEGHTGISGRQRGFWALRVVSVAGGLAAQGSARLENPRAMQRKVNRDGDHHSQAVLERHGSRTGTFLAGSPSLTLFRSGALPGNGVREEWRLLNARLLRLTRWVFPDSSDFGGVFRGIHGAAG